LGNAAFRRFLDASSTDRPAEECVRHLSKAERYYRHALEIFPEDATHDLATVHHQIGLVCGHAGQIDNALRHDRESIRYSEAMRDRFRAGGTRHSAAVILRGAGLFADARDWAQAALRDYQACENADQEIMKTLKLLERIESRLRATSPPS
jgi:tetratricopeptide (TPR) repeat protein